MSKYEDDNGNVWMVCNSCGEETLDWECCTDGEVSHYGDCDCGECWFAEERRKLGHDPTPPVEQPPIQEKRP